MTNKSRIHFISIGGSVMHNLAIALKNKGFSVSGNDDEIFEPSKSKLLAAGLLPDRIGWDPESITEDLDAVIIGMHAKADNPELLKAKHLGIPVYSFPDFIRQQCEHKQRIVIAGSHGKTTITSIIIHILHEMDREFDYVVGAASGDMELTVKLTDAPVIIIEGDEYLTSPLDRVPKFMKYEHHMVLVSGIAWDHMNVFPTFESYVKQFEHLIEHTPKSGSIIYYDKDQNVVPFATKERLDVKALPYGTHPFTINEGTTYLVTDHGQLPVQLMGEHNMQNISGALTLLQRIGVRPEQFYEHIQTFTGVDRRLEKIIESDGFRILRDFAHAPSKVSASTQAIKQQFPDEKLVAVLELHTFSSLNKGFLPHYQGTLDSADVPIVFLTEHTLAHKGLPPISEDEIRQFFKNDEIRLLGGRDSLADLLTSYSTERTNYLLMSSGNFAGLDLSGIVSTLRQQA